MGTVVEVKVRRVGTSLGLLLPKEFISEEHLKEGQHVRLLISRKPSKAEIEKALGSMKGLGPFKREKSDRIDGYLSGNY